MEARMTPETSNNAGPLLSRFQELSSHFGPQQYIVVPVDDFAIFRILASEIARTTAADTANDLLLIVDSKTVSEVDAVDLARWSASRTYVFGPCPGEWVGQPNICAAPYTAEVRENDHFMILLSSGLSFAIVGRVNGPSAPDDSFTGAWSGQRAHVIRAADLLLGNAEEGLTSEKLLSRKKPNVECSYSCSMRLMAVLTRQLTLRHRDMAMDKNDLFSILNILKAISAKRRAHDILYVFVEQIARAVKMERCSVVRVWNDERQGHVLASHENPDIQDLTIDLEKYPEILHAMKTHEKAVINNVARDPLMRKFSSELKIARIQSLLVIPIVLHDQNVGSFLLRAARSTEDFSLREINFCEVVAEAASNALERAHLFESIQIANERLEQLAITDGLTGVYNHRFFRERIGEEFERARRYGLPLACIILDVDNFKQINDTFGHLQGDNILRELADRTAQTVRKSDIVARYGGEEFAVIMPQTGAVGAQAQGLRLLERIGQHPFAGMPPERPITVSIGVGILDSDTMENCEALIRVADNALYEAKRSGKNRVVMGTL